MRGQPRGDCHCKHKHKHNSNLGASTVIFMKPAYTKTPALMGIINLSPNSFYNACTNLDEALHLAERMVAEGADILDMGAEATNPMTELNNDRSQELKQLIPAIEAIKQRFDIKISVDTSWPEVMQAVVDVGADMINDQRALQIPGALQMAVKLEVPVCLMHGFVPSRVAGSTTAEDLLSKIKTDFSRWINEYQAAGLNTTQIILDPGFGAGHYGKNTAENFYLLKHLDQLVELGYPVLVGWSRKSMLGEILNKPVEDRLFGSVAVSVILAQKGTAIIRTHDVGPTADALKVVEHLL